MLFCITANYTPKAMQAMAKKPNTNRSEAFEKLVKAAGGKLVAMYATMTDGPGALAIFDADPAVAPSVGAVVASSDGVHNFKMVRLFTMDEVIGIRKKKIELQKSYSPPGE
ncbi:MAG: GYD domain-containing protein [Xanthobacteraceae bacterium]